MAGILAEIGPSGRIDVKAQRWQDDAIKALPGARYDSHRDLWTMPTCWPACLQLRSAFLGDLEVGPKLAEWSRKELLGRIRPSLERRVLMDGPGDPATFPHVRAGAHWLEVAGDCLLLNDMGGAKTHQAVDAMRADPGPHLVVSTNSMLWTWKDECEQWWPECRVSVVTGNAKRRREALAGEADVYVVAWQNLIRHSRLAAYGNHRLSDAERVPKELNARQWGTVVADEIHRAKSPGAKQTRALWYVGDSARRRIGMTGTPVVNEVDELWSLLRFCAPYEWADHGRYQKRYCDTSWTGWGLAVTGLKPANQIEFRRASEPRWRRVPAAVFRGERAEPEHRVIPVEMPAKQAAQYKAMKADKDVEPLVRATRLWQLASSCLDDDMRPVFPSGKVDAVLELLDDIDGQVVLFMQHAQLLGLIASKLPAESFGEISGRVGSTVERKRHLDAFARGDQRIMLCTYGAGSEGIKLTAAQTIIAVQDTWSNVAASQAVARLDRPGQMGDVQVLHLQTRGTIDRIVMTRAQEKGFQLESFVKDEESLVRLLQGTEEL